MPQDTFNLDDLPDEIDLSSLPDEPKPQQSLLSNLWEKANAPLTTLPGKITKALAPFIVPGGVSPTMLRIGQDFNNGLTSPINLALTALSGGEYAAGKAGLTGLESLLNAGSRAASVPFAIEGANKAIKGDTLLEKGLGLAELGGGILGARRSGIKPEIKPQLLLEAPNPRFVSHPSGKLADIFDPNASETLRSLDLKQPETTLRDIDLRPDQYFTLPNKTGNTRDVIPTLERPNVPLPNETTFGFNPQSQIEEYPYNIVPERLGPRSVQNVEAGLARGQNEPIKTLEQGTGADYSKPAKTVTIGEGLDEVKQPEVKALEEKLPTAPKARAKKIAEQPKAEFEYVNGEYVHHTDTPTTPQPQAKKVNLVRDFIKEEEGGFDPNVITQKIRAALDDAEQNKGYIPHPTSQVQGVVGKLFAAIQDAKADSVLQEEFLSQQRAERALKFRQNYGKGAKGAYAALGQLKGKYDQIPRQPLTLNDTDVDSLFDVIKGSKLREYESARAITALGKLLSGESVPQRNELALLDRVYGKGFSKVTTELYGGLGAIPGGFKPITELANITRAMKTSFDLSAPLRQGITLIHRPEYWRSFWEMNKGLGKESWYRDIMDSIYKKDIFQPMNQKGESFADMIGLRMTNLEDYAAQEEQYMSRLAEKILGVSHSERAYLGFLNKLRADTTESLLNAAEKQGLDPYNNIALAKEIADYVNNATGRGSLVFGKHDLERYAIPLNNALFSPRFIASRVKFLTPTTYTKATPFVRQQYLKSLGALVGSGLTALALAKAAGAEVNSDPKNSDFMKAKLGNTRVDPWGGFQQYITAFSNTVDEVKKNYYEGQKPDYSHLPASLKFGYYKLSPAASTTVRLIFGKDPITGQRLTLTDEAERNFAPMFIDDVLHMLREDPEALPTIPLELYGYGVQNYNSLKEQRPFGQ